MRWEMPSFHVSINQSINQSLFQAVSRLNKVKKEKVKEHKT